MFTEKDYMEYLESIISIENSMLFYVKDLESKLQDPGILASLDTVLSDEMNKAFQIEMETLINHNELPELPNPIPTFTKYKAINGTTIIIEAISHQVEAKEKELLHNFITKLVESKEGQLESGDLVAELYPFINALVDGRG